MTSSSKITDYIGCGLAAARPATPSLASGSFGIYYATDTGALTIWNGSSWSSLSGSGTVTSVGLSTPLGGGTVTTTGTLGTSSFTNHGVLIGQGSSALAVTSAGTSGQVLTSNGASADPTFQTLATAARVLITETTTSASQSTVTFSSIPATYRDLEVVVRGRGTVSATQADVIMQFNTDTGSNYDYESASSAHTTISGGAQVATTFIYLGAITGDTATASVAGSAQAMVYDYRGTTFQKAVIANSAYKLGTSLANIGRSYNSGFWRSTSAITQIDVKFASGNFKDGSVVSLYGLM